MADVEPPLKWQKYVKFYEDATSRYKPCFNDKFNSVRNNPDIDGSSNNVPSSTTPSDKLSCFYADVIEKDLSVFNGRIR